MTWHFPEFPCIWLSQKDLKNFSDNSDDSFKDKIRSSIVLPAWYEVLSFAWLVNSVSFKSFQSKSIEFGFATSSAKGFVSLCSEFVKFFAFKKNKFSSFYVLSKDFAILRLSERRCLTVFHNFLLSATLFHLDLRNIVFWFFLKDLQNNCVAW